MIGIRVSDLEPKRTVSSEHEDEPRVWRVLLLLEEGVGVLK
jgi:hypothetical protein